MEGKMDSLQIEISANSKSAAKSINDLAGSLMKLQGSLKGISNGQFQNLSSGIRQLSDSMERFSGTVKTADFTRIADGLNKLSSVKIQGVSNASRAISTLTKNLNEAGTISFDSQGIANIANSVAQLGRKTVTQASKNIPELTNSLKGLKEGLEGFKITGANFDSLAQLTASISKLGGKNATIAAEGNIAKLTTSLNNMMTTLSKAPRVSNNIIQMTQALAQLAGAGGKAGVTARNLSSSFNTFSLSSKKASKSAGGLATAFGKFYATYWLLIRGMGQFKNAIDISSDLTEVQNVVDVSFGDMSDKMNEFADSALQLYGMSELTAKQIGSRFQAMGVSMGFAQEDMSDMSIRLTQLAGDLASFYNISQDSAAQKLQSIFTGETEPLRALGLDLSFATVEAWALSQGINANMQSMTQAEKTMLRYQYVLANTGQATGDFQRTINSWANQIRLLKGAFEELASIVGGVLVNALKPLVKALNTAMSYVISFAETISNALGKIFGWTYEEGGGAGLAEDFGSAAGSAGEIADSTGTAAQNIKKMQAGLRSFDELKTINISDGNTGGSGGSGGGTSGGGSGAGASGGDWVKTDSILKSFESEIDTLSELGEYIGKTLTKTLNSIDWDKVYQGAKNFGKGLADFLNGLISPELFGATGRTIAGALNTAIYAALSFGETFDWSNLGLSIATGINEFFRTFDFAALAETLNVWVDGIWNTIKTAISNIDWGEIWNDVKEFFSNLNLSTAVVLSILIAPAAIKGIQTLIGLFAQLIPFISTVGSAFSTLGGFIAGLSAPILAVVLAISSFIVGLGYVFSTNEEVRNSFSQSISTIKDSLQPALEFLTGTVLPDLKSGWKGILDVLSPLGEYLEGAFTDVWQEIINPALTYIGETVLPKVTESFKNLWNNVLVPLGQFLQEVFSPIIEKVSEILKMLWENIVLPLAQAVGDILGKAFEGICQIFNETVIPIVSNVINILKFLWENVLSPIVNFLWDVFKPAFENVFETIGDIINGIKDIFSGLIDFVVGIFTGDWERAWEGVKQIFTGIWETLSSVVKIPINSLIGIFEGLANKIIDAWNWIKSGINSLSIDLPEALGGELSFNLGMSEHISIPRFAVGGFPEDGLFYANHSEIVGKFSNGRTAVANNEQITQGIADAVYPAVYNAVSAAMKNSGGSANVTFQVEGDPNGLFKVVRKQANDYTGRTGKPAFDF